MKKLLLFLSVIFITFTIGVTKTFAQVNISSGQTVTQNFDGIGFDLVATVPTGWKVDKQSDVRLLGAYSAALTATERRGGDNMSSTAANGIYNYGAGDPATATDRAIGFISSSSATKSGNLYVQIQNNGMGNINFFTLSFDVEKYRDGTNAAGFTVQLHYSLDGTTWTDAGPDFKVSFPGGDAANAGFTPAPGATVAVTNKDLNVIVAPAGSLYLAWNYSVTTGATTSNAQGLGIDNVIIKAADASTVDDATLSSLTSSMGILNPVFHPATFNYTALLPYGTSIVPTVSAIASNPLANVTITQATNVISLIAAERTATIVVVSEDLSETFTYTVEFNVSPTQSDDATLSSLTCSVTPLVPTFSPTVFYYTVQLPFGATTTPTVTATANYPFANVTIIPATDVTSADSLERTTTVHIVAENGTDFNQYLVQFNPSNITVVDVANIAALRAGLTDGTVYRLTGEAFLSYKQTYRNQKFVQDASAAIMIDDFNNVLSTPYNIGDGITNLVGTLTVYNNMLQFIPTVNPGAATSAGNVIVAHLKTCSSVYAEDQAKLLRFLNGNFVNPTGNFATNQNYNFTDGTGTIVFRTNFHEADYIGSPVPTFNVDVIGIYIQYLNTKQITARFATDIVQATNVNSINNNSFTFDAYPNPSSGNINFDFNLDKTSDVIFSIKDINGKEVYTYNALLDAGTHQISWFESGKIESGIYFYSVSINNVLKNGKLIITK